MIIPNKFNGYFAENSGHRRLFKKGGGSNKAYKLEKQRLANMENAINAINGIFDKNYGVDALTDYSQYDPDKTYYNADGSVYTTPYKTVTSSSGKGGGVPTTSQVVDYDALNNAIASGNVYSGTRNSRQDLYDQQNQAVYELNKQKLDENYADQVRANKFALARNGLLGGSADVDSNADLQDRYNKGLVQAEALGQEAAAKLQTQDESARSNLIGLAESGLDAGSASAQATQSLANNYDTALGQRGAASINNFFNDMGQLYLTNKIGQALQQDPYGSWYGRNQNVGGLNIRGGDQGQQ